VQLPPAPRAHRGHRDRHDLDRARARQAIDALLALKDAAEAARAAGAEEFCAIRSYLATAAPRHGISTLDALTRAFQGNPWIPETG
jgi:hypothetical protein